MNILENYETAISALNLKKAKIDRLQVLLELAKADEQPSRTFNWDYLEALLISSPEFIEAGGYFETGVAKLEGFQGYNLLNEFMGLDDMHKLANILQNRRASITDNHQYSEARILYKTSDVVIRLKLAIAAAEQHQNSN